MVYEYRVRGQFRTNFTVENEKLPKNDRLKSIRNNEQRLPWSVRTVNLNRKKNVKVRARQVILTVVNNLEAKSGNKVYSHVNFPLTISSYGNILVAILIRYYNVDNMYSMTPQVTSSSDFHIVLGSSLTTA